MRKLLMTLAIASVVAAGVASPVLASQPNGLKGYEGQPGNQGGQQHHKAPGLLGYEGQPGNQGG